MRRELGVEASMIASEPFIVGAAQGMAPVEPIADFYHGFEVVDPYRWLEDGDAPRTRRWLAEQDRVWRHYLESTPSRDRIRQRVAELLSVESCAIPRIAGERQFFSKRGADHEQPWIYMREGDTGEDILLVDPSKRDKFTAVNIVAISKEGKFSKFLISIVANFCRIHCLVGIGASFSSLRTPRVSSTSMSFLASLNLSSTHCSNTRSAPVRLRTARSIPPGTTHACD